MEIGCGDSSPHAACNFVHSRVCSARVQRSKVLRRGENTHFFGRVSKIGRFAQGVVVLRAGGIKDVSPGGGLLKMRKMLLKTQEF